jgi:ribonuclease Z
VNLKFIGTSSGKTSLNRFHSSILVSIENYGLLVDAGDGISRALLSHNINFKEINGIIFTHLHPDHFSGLPALIVQMKMNDRNIPLDIFIHHSLENVVKDSLLHSYLLPERMNFEISYKTIKDNEQLKISKNFSVLARKNSHLIELEQYQSNYSAISFYSASLLLEAERKKIVYTSDIGLMEDLLLFKEIVSDIYIMETTHLPISSLADAIQIIKAGKIFFTHYSDEDIPKLNEIMATLPANIKPKAFLATDGKSFEI